MPFRSLVIPIIRGLVSFMLFAVVAILLGVSPNIAAADVEAPAPDHAAEISWLELLDRPLHRAPHPRPDLQSAAKCVDWQAMIDAVWGPGLPGSIQTTAFQNFMTTLDSEFACFTNRDIDLVSLYTPYLAELEAGVSKGRFQAIMSRMCLTLQNGHTSFLDLDVYLTLPEPGVPLLVGHRYNNNPYFGACLTTGDDGVFVYDVVADHPLGLEVGDVILGYDGRPWTELYPELLAAELPIGGGGWLTSDASYRYGWEISVGNNWHLFDTIDIRKFSTGKVKHLPTNLMVDSGVDLSIYCSDQLNDDIPRPTAPDWATWGVLDVGDRRIGFIWVDAWTGDVEVAWGRACYEMVNDPDLDGLIIDFRNNTGGNMHLSNSGLLHLFDRTVLTIDFAYRINPYDHQSLSRFGYAANYSIPGNPASYFDKPIAVLLGPKAISSGDQVALRMTYHPMVRTFGRPTSATFDSPVAYPVSLYGDFWSRYSKYEAGRVETPHDYLTHLGFPVDQEVWLEPQDCRDGVDTVIREAIAWIAPDVSQVPGEFGRVGSRITGAAPNPGNPRTTISFEIRRAGPCRLEIVDVAGRLVRSRQWADATVGSHEFVWDGRMDSGRGVASGTYLVRLIAADGIDRTRITLLK